MSGVKVRLAVMMFLQYCIWGGWAPILAVYLGDLESFREGTGSKINYIYMTMAIASMLSPLIAGQLADRFFSTEKFLAFSHLCGGLTLFWASQIGDFYALFGVMMLHSLFYAPTVSLTNSLAFSHLPNGEKDFGFIRMFGTVGWIAIGWAFSLWLGLSDQFVGENGLPKPNAGHSLVVGAALSVIMAVFCLFLPRTPPSPSTAKPFAFLESFRLCRDRSFLVLIVVSFLVSTELQFYYVLTPNFFVDEPGDSLTQRELISSAEFDEDADKNAALLIRQLDINSPRNRKLSKTELEQAGERLNELKMTLDHLPKSDGLFETQQIRDAVNAAKLPTETREDVSLAAYVLKTADENGDSKLTREELDTFIKKVEPLQPNVEKALAAFDAKATEKGGLALTSSWAQRVMTFGQIMEILVLLILPFALTRLGFGVTISIGIAAWAVRYAIFALGDPVWAVIASQALHGFGFGFFFVGAMIYADRIAPKDIRASAQALIIFITYGLGMVISSLIAGPVADYFDFNWHSIFLVPVAITTLCTLLFLAFFRETKAVSNEDTTPGEQREGTEVG